MPNKFSITWCQSENEFPGIGQICPTCNVGEVKKSQYNDGHYCSSCKWSWRKSKFDRVPSNKDFKTTPEMKEENEAFKAVDEVERIMKAISLVKGQVAIIEAAMDIFKKDFDERMDKLGEYLKDKTIVE